MHKNENPVKLPFTAKISNLRIFLNPLLTLSDIKDFSANFEPRDFTGTWNLQSEFQLFVCSGYEGDRVQSLKKMLSARSSISKKDRSSNHKNDEPWNSPNPNEILCEKTLETVQTD